MLNRWSRLAQVGRVAGFAAGLTLTASIAYAENPLQAIEKPIKGVYVWGDNTKGLISAEPEKGVLEPVRVQYFDNQSLRDLAVAPNVGVAAMKDGSVVEWDSPNGQKTVLKGKGITQVRTTESGDQIVALGGNGSIYLWTAGDISSLKQLTVPSLGWFDKVVDIRVGDDHVVGLTSSGRVVTALIRELKRHEGQLGLASYPSFDPAPAPFVFHIVKLLEEHKIAQIASGSHHAVARTTKGDVFGFGRNLYGQLTLPYAFKNVKISVPTPVSTKQAGNYSSNFVDIAAGGNVTYLRDDQNHTFVSGNGILAQFGTGSFAHTQATPLRITALEELKEYDEKAKQIKAIVPNKWSVSATHTFAQLSTGSRDWIVWGANHFGQQGNGKRALVVKPQHVSRTLLAETVNGDTFVAGTGISACYTKV